MQRVLLSLGVVLVAILVLAAAYLYEHESDGSPRASVLASLSQTAAGPRADPEIGFESSTERGVGAAADLGETTEGADLDSPLALALTPQAEPTDPNDDTIHFPETGHNLTLFKDFWERSDGATVFGAPLTEAYEDHDAETGEPRSVQYFATQRIEHHSEHEGTPFEYLLGRLGYEDAQRRGLLTSEPFDPVSESTPSTSECLFIEQTRHTICGDFREFWEQHGVDLGDPDISRRESIALFGYPISEEFVSPSSGIRVQYFERARLEYHPETADGQRVVMAWLGADALAQRLAEE